MRRKYSGPLLLKRIFCLSFSIGIAVAACESRAQATTEARPLWQFSVSDQLLYDSNLFRLPDSVGDPSPFVGSGTDVAREDYINRVSAGVEGQWSIAQQEISVTLRADDNCFQHNDTLNYISTKDRVQWGWILGGRLSGTLGGDYSRSLVNFANNRVYQKDLLKSVGYFGELRYRLGIDH